MGVDVAIRSYSDGIVSLIDCSNLHIASRSAARAFIVQLARNLAPRQLTLVADGLGERRHLSGSADTMLTGVNDTVDGLEAAGHDHRWRAGDP